MPRSKEENAARQREYRKKYPERVKATAKRAWLKYREKVDHETLRQARRKYHLWHNFKITPEQYDQKLKEQGELCAVCREPETVIYRGSRKSLDVDHCHTTGKVRDLLCGACNASLGLLKENSLRIRALADYIERHNGQ